MLRSNSTAMSRNAQGSDTSNPLVPFHDTWDQQRTREVALGAALSGRLQAETHTDTGHDMATLAIVRGLEAARRSGPMKQAEAGDPPITREQLDRLTDYLTQLATVILKLGEEAGAVKLEPQWTSPMAGKPSSFYKLKGGLLAEAGMAAFQYAGALRAYAWRCLDQPDIVTAAPTSPSPADASPDSGGAGAAIAAAASAEAATSLRQAAGVYDWLSMWCLPRVAQHLAAEYPTELSISLSRVLAQVSLGEAQAVTAHRAEQRGSALGLVCVLHAGSWELVEGAARSLKDCAQDFKHIGLSDRLKRFLAVSSGLARARALRCLALDLSKAKQQAGLGEAACVEGEKLLSGCHAAAEGDAGWRALIKQEQAVLEDTRKIVEKDRTAVYYQTISKTPPELPQGKVLVKAVPFAPGGLGSTGAAPAPPPAGPSGAASVAGEGEGEGGAASSQGTGAAAAAALASLTLSSQGSQDLGPGGASSRYAALALKSGSFGRHNLLGAGHSAGSSPGGGNYTAAGYPSHLHGSPLKQPQDLI